MIILFSQTFSPSTGQLILPGDGAYEYMRQLWNGKVDIHPTAFVRCVNTQDVIHTVQWARSHGLPLSVLGGGNDFGKPLVDQIQPTTYGAFIYTRKDGVPGASLATRRSNTSCLIKRPSPLSALSTLIANSLGLQRK